MASSHALSKDAVLQLHAQLRMLLDAELFESALDLAQVVISASERQPAMPAVGMGSTADACIMAGDASRGNGENARAAAYYKRAISRIESDGTRLKELECKCLLGGVRFKLAKCQAAQGDHDKALATLRAIPPRVRPPAAVVLMAKMMIVAGTADSARNHAQAALQESIRMCPFALELVPYLRAHGVSSTQFEAQLAAAAVPAVACPAGSVVDSVAGIVWGTIPGAGTAPDTSSSSSPPSVGAGAGAGTGTPATPAAGSAGEGRLPASSPSSYARERTELCADNRQWMVDLVRAHEAHVTGEHPLSQHKFQRLHDSFPESMALSIALACAHSRRRQSEDALRVMQEARRRDPHTVAGVERLSQFHAEAGNTAGMAALARQAMEVDPRHPNSWIALAVAQILNRQPYLEALQRAEELGRDHVGVQYMAASLRNSSDWDKTVAAFRRAALLRQDVGSLRGLTLALVAQRQLRAALQAATRLMRLAPKSPHSHCVMGQVLAESENCEDKAERALRSALAIDPTEETAAGALAKLQAKTGKQELAAETLRTALRSRQDADLQCQLGQVLRQMGDARGAMTAFHTALSLRPGMSAASDGLRELEEEARGLAPTESRAGQGDVEVVGD